MSHEWLDAKYVSLLGGRLRNFKKKGRNSWNFSCPSCGDSKTNQRKARGYVFPAKGTLLFHCHNCNVTMDVPKLVKSLDVGLYDQYIQEKLTADRSDTAAKEQLDHEAFVKKLTPPKFISSTPLGKLRKVSQLAPEHPVKQWVDRRMIPPEVHHKLFLCMKFKELVNEFTPGKFESLEHDEPRLIIPFLDKDRNLFGFQGRDFKKKSALRYITIMLSEDLPKMYGWDTVDTTKHVYVLEGPIDSMFLPNAIASAGGKITSDLNAVSSDKSLFTIVYDNEPRNLETVLKMEKAIKAGFPTCIWPDNISEKDVNDMVLSGVRPEKLVDIIDENTYIGLEASLKLAAWRKIG